MGSLITLGVGRLEIDWGKNSYFTNHSRLFFRDDVKPEIYYYADNVQEVQPAFSRPLRKVLPRLELLGYSLANCRRLYEKATYAVPDYYPDPEISFDMLARIIASVDLTRLGKTRPISTRTSSGVFRMSWSQAGSVIIWTTSMKAWEMPSASWWSQKGRRTVPS